MVKGMGLEPMSPRIPPRRSPIELSSRIYRNFRCPLKSNETEHKTSQGDAPCFVVLAIKEARYVSEKG